MRKFYDTTIGWRFVNPLMKAQYGVDSMPETGENVAEEFKMTREAQDKFAIRRQAKACVCGVKNGVFDREIVPVTIPQRKGDPVIVSRDEHPRETTIEAPGKLGTPFRKGGTVTAGNASGVNDGAAALIIASEAAVKKYGLTPIARILGGPQRGCCAAHHGHRPCTCDAEALCAPWHQAIGFRRDRTQRSLRQPGHRPPCASSALRMMRHT